MSNKARFRMVRNYILILLIVVASCIVLLSSCVEIKIDKGEFFVEYPKNGEKNVPLQFTVKIEDSEFSKAVTYDVYINGELVEMNVNSTEITLNEKLEPNREYVMMVSRKIFGRVGEERKLVRFTTTRKPVFVYVAPSNGMEYYEGMRFEWQAIDLDNDELSYDVYIGEIGGNLTLVASSLKRNWYLPENLATGEEYKWKVVVKDDKGAENEIEVEKFTYLKVPIVKKYKMYGVGTDGLWEFDVYLSENAYIKGKRVIEGNYYDLLYHDGKLYVRPVDMSVEVYKINPLGDLEKIGKFGTGDGTYAFKYENGYLLGFGNVCHFAYDLSRNKLLLRGCEWGNGDTRFFMSYDGRYLLELLSYGDPWGDVWGHYRLRIYDNNMNQVFYDEKDTAGKLIRGALIYNEKLYIAMVYRGVTKLEVYDFSDPVNLNLETPENSGILKNGESFLVKMKIANGKIIVVSDEHDVFIVDPETLSVVAYNTENSINDIEILSYSSYYIAPCGESGAFGIKIFDENLNEVLSYNTDDSRTKADMIALSDNYVFVVNQTDAPPFDESKRIVVYGKDLSFVGYIGYYKWINDMKALGNRLFVEENDRISIYDVTDIENPIRVSEISEYNIKDFEVDENYVYVLTPDQLIVYDISDINNPRRIYVLFTNSKENQYLNVNGNLAVIVSGGNISYEFVDMTDRTSPKIVFDKDSEGSLMYGGKPVIVDNYVYIFVDDISMDHEHQIHIYDVSDINDPKLVNTVKNDLCYQFKRVEVYDNYMIIGSCGSKIYDISNKANPLYVSDLPENSNFIDIDKESGLIYITKWEKGVYAYDVNDIVTSGNASPVYSDVWFAIYDVAVGE